MMDTLFFPPPVEESLPLEACGSEVEASSVAVVPAVSCQASCRAWAAAFQGLAGQAAGVEEVATAFSAGYWLKGLAVEGVAIWAWVGVRRSRPLVSLVW